MRRSDRAVSPEEARLLLESAEYGVLSMSSDQSEPHGIPLNFALKDNNIYFHCAVEGKKVEILSSNPRVSFCVVGATEVLPEKFSTKYESVIVTGIAEEVFGEEKREGLALLIHKYSYDYAEEGKKYVDKSAEHTKVFRIDMDSMTGKARK